MVTIYCYTKFPPTCAADAFFNNEANCTVYVTKEAYPLYAADNYWMRFNLQIMDDSMVGIESVQRTDSNATATYYDSMGRRTTNKARGMHIIRTTDGKAKKVMTL